jgi:ATP-dependent protease ClpP protease subunit
MKKIIGIGLIFLLAMFAGNTHTQMQAMTLEELLQSQLDTEAPATPKEAEDQQKEKKGKVYTICLFGKIVAPEQYINILEMLGNVTEKDIVIFKINSPGGRLDTMVQIINAIKDSKARTIAEVYTAYSAAGFITMACKQIVVKQHATMMIHSFQTGTSGDITQMKNEIDFFKKMNDQMLTDTFKGFLTSQELEMVKNGKEIWLYEDEIKERLTKIAR